MRPARAKVVKGKTVMRSKFPEETKLVLVVDEPQAAVVLDAEDELAIRHAPASLRAGKSVPMDKLLALVDRT